VFIRTVIPSKFDVLKGRESQNKKRYFVKIMVIKTELASSTEWTRTKPMFGSVVPQNCSMIESGEELETNLL